MSIHANQCRKTTTKASHPRNHNRPHPASTNNHAKTSRKATNAPLPDERARAASQTRATKSSYGPLSKRDLPRGKTAKCAWSALSVILN